MTFNRDKTYSGWCCTDCLFWLANGDEPGRDYMTEAEVADWRARIAQHTAGTEVTLGAFREDHDCATNWTVTWHAPGSVRGSFRRGYLEVRADTYGEAMDEAYWSVDTPAGAQGVMAHWHELETQADRGGDCECEQVTFSHTSCDVCGSHLAGAREAVVFWLQDDPVSASTPEPSYSELGIRVNATEG